MKLSGTSISDPALIKAVQPAIAMLRAGSFSELAKHFGYAVSLGREVETAIKDDLSQSLCEIGASQLAPGERYDVKHFNPDAMGIRTVVECRVATDVTESILVEFVVSGDSDRWLSMEQISSVQ